MSLTRNARTRLTVAAAALLLPIGVAAPAYAAAPPSQQQDSRSVGDRVLDEAPLHRGKRYVYGATGPDTFDCSGFVQYVFAQVGVSLPRTSRDQYAVSQKVAQHERRPGDLIAMKDSRGRVTHVGVYGGNDDWWVASTSAKRVIHQKLYSSNYSVGRFS
jgi:cell wall-associated NlpC family hydrolase